MSEDTTPGPITSQSILDSISTDGGVNHDRILFYAEPGFGKTSFAAQFPDPVFICTPGETGIQTLIRTGEVPPTPYLPECTSYDVLLDQLRALAKSDYETVVIDEAGGIDNLVHTHCCNKDFGGDWGEKGFMSFHKGYSVSLQYWQAITRGALDYLRLKCNKRIIMLCHSQITQRPNTSGEEFGCYTPAVHHKTWKLLGGWFDIVLLGNFNISTYKRENGKGSYVKGGGRQLITEPNPAWEAKNRHGLPAEIEMGNSAKEAYNNYTNALQKGKE